MGVGGRPARAELVLRQFQALLPFHPFREKPSSSHCPVQPFFTGEQPGERNMCTGSSSDKDVSSSQISGSIDKQIKQDEKKLHSQVKLLLLGMAYPALVVYMRVLTRVNRFRRKREVDHTKGTLHLH